MSNIAAELDADAVAAVIDALHQTLAETCVATMKAQNFHWNVTGMAFGPLHDLFQTIYEDHFEAQDDIAERIKALDGHADDARGPGDARRRALRPRRAGRGEGRRHHERLRDRPRRGPREVRLDAPRASRLTPRRARRTGTAAVAAAAAALTW